MSFGSIGSTLSDLIGRVSILAVGLTSMRIINALWDYGLYPLVIWRLGFVFGGIVMTACSMALCLLVLYFYDWTKKDWLGIETIKSFRAPSRGSWSGQIASRILEKGNAAAFVFLSLAFDPFITTAYMRHGSHQFNGLTRRDWIIFLTSGIVGNAYWTLVSYTGVSVIGSIWTDGVNFLYELAKGA